MELTFGASQSLPEKYIPGRIYFIGDNGAIYVAISETEVVQYSSYKQILELASNKQDIIEDLEVIRNDAALGASMAQSISTIDNSDIDNLFETI